MAETIELVVNANTPVSVTTEGRKYITCTELGARILWSTSVNGPWHTEVVSKSIDLPNLPVYVKSLGSPLVLTVTVYDS